MSDVMSKAERAMGFAQQQVGKLLDKYPDYFPMYTVGGKWKQEKELWTHWCEGFLPGMIWMFTRHSDDPKWRPLAETLSAKLEHRKDDRNVHDLGFIFYHGTYKRWYESLISDQTLDEDKAAEVNAVVVHAGQTLAMRFKEKGQYLRSFISDESLFIDIMMNVPIIFYAAEATDDQELYDTALRHCLTTRRYLLRGDGSTSHEGIFDLNTGEFLRQTTHQGLRGDSCWSRGLAWSLYGFSICYSQTGLPEFLDAAQRNADFYLNHTPDDGVPPWDYDAPDNGPLSSLQPDTSAAAIAACGLLELSKLTPDFARCVAYRQYARRIVETLCEPPYLAIDDPNWEGILKRGVYHIHKKLGVDESVMWGEYFFIEALDRVLCGEC